MNKQDKLYIIEDDTTIVTLLKQHFSNYYQVYAVTNFRDIKQEVESIQPDVILMDITLPFFNGFYWTSEIRKTMTVPIIFISSSNDDMDAVMALNMGGDDFISKPFSLNVLEAKISAFLRRSKQFNKEELSFAGYELLADGTVVSDQHESIDLSPTEAKILRILMTHDQQVIAKEDFLEKLWQDDSFIDHNTLNVNMTRLRKKLKSIGFDHIHTARGVGYFLK
ncbi:response regulator transcription factor [Streptococcus thoraltensis]|uniref:response regulator transcription factor n=1 Tax=Streptococcus thoraltensis TaxID=55085 RepID=UPI000369E9CF|nr:response regulator transcription factor [Streptococcus thoraltensis]MDY4761052.1 response regulator transcription factor [Streptococcus thoraltensis]